ncbi:MAG: 5-(carboxyamino)imidazole ribonucleotide mutase [Bdellovibrionaceae bacterium]|nr:5-(carboxyamino)imidazole ribonucleotide mutase [Pseudobdellovibrionaceae bacterium]
MPIKNKVAVLMGSPSDIKIMSKGINLLKEWKVPTEVKVVSAHRTPEFMQEYGLKAQDRGLEVIIAGAGGSAHLPGMLASLTVLPVIGVPIALKKLKGLDSLLSIVQMPKGVPVATVAINNSYNAALLALRFLALKDPILEKKLKNFNKKQKQKSLKSNKLLKEILS